MEILIDTIKDTYLMLPILCITYILLEWYERKTDHNPDIFIKLQHYGPLLGASLGIIPQCGFSVVASMLFLENKITLGTLLSVFIATSDEALPILLASPNMFDSLLAIIISKFILGLLVGYLIDIFYKGSHFQSHDLQVHHHENNLLVSALQRTFKIFGFIFLLSLLLNFVIEMIGEDTLSGLLLQNTIIQPIITAIFGFIPNCVASVLLSQLYLRGSLSFASLLSGLITNAGLGLVILYRYKLAKKTFFIICTILLTSAIFVGIIFQLLL